MPGPNDTAPPPADATPEEHAPHANYLLVFVALCVCTLLSVATEVVPLPSRTLLVALVFAIAAAKALFVMVYFMHLKFEGRWKYLLLGPTFLLGGGLVLGLLPDIGIHYYTVEADHTDATRTLAGNED